MSSDDNNSATPSGGDNLVNMEGVQSAIRDHFLGWQCRLRQHSIRNLNGEPSPGMTPDMVVGGGDTGYEGIKVLLVRHDPSEHTPEIKHMVRKTRDPKQRYDNALKYFAESYYQDKSLFSDCMTALFSAESAAAARLHDAASATLVFFEKNQRYVIPSEVRRLNDDDPVWQSTYWHNHLFNPVLPGDSIVLQFVPDWSRTKAEPPVY